jgi:hypothetical protein
MKTEGMQVKTKRKFKATPYSDHDDPIAPNVAHGGFLRHIGCLYRCARASHSLVFFG